MVLIIIDVTNQVGHSLRDFYEHVIRLFRLDLVGLRSLSFLFYHTF